MVYTFVFSEPNTLARASKLGIINEFLDQIIVKGYLLDAAGERLFEKSVNSVIWPLGIGRLPDNVRRTLLFLFPD